MKQQPSLNSLVTILAFTSLATVNTAHAEGDFFEAISSGTASGSLRLRAESVDDSVNKKAKALTLRTLLNYSTDTVNGFGATLEFEQVDILDSRDSYAPVTAGYATIADPESREMNQAYLSYNNELGIAVKLGRQKILLDNQRFVGAVGWRQDDQTFDALSVNYKSGDLTAHYSFIRKVKGILPRFDAKTSHNLINVSYQWLPQLTTTFYSYLLNDDDSNAAANNSSTTGLRLTGKAPLADKLSLSYTAEAAAQDADDFETLYLHGEVGVGFGGALLAAGYEELGSDNGKYAFQTPLATKHAFNGWADKFLATPASGLEDSYIKAAYGHGALKTAFFYHNYEADDGGSDYGEEADAVVTYKVHKQLVIGTKYAHYNGKDYSDDTEKFWVWTQLSF